MAFSREACIDQVRYMNLVISMKKIKVELSIYLFSLYMCKYAKNVTLKQRHYPASSSNLT